MPGYKDVPWMTGAYLGIFGDPFIFETELDGNSPSAAAMSLATMCGRLQRTSDQLGWGVDTGIVQQVKELFEESVRLPGGSHLSEKIANLQKLLREMPVDKFICLQSGWSTPDGGHAITVNFHKTAADKVSLIVINSGQGLGAHPSRSSSWALSSGGSRLAMRFDDIPLARASDEVGLWMLLKQTSSASADHKPFAFYQIYLPYVLNRPLPDALAPSFKHGHDAKAGDWMKPQRAGTCYFRGNLATLKYYARLRGMSRDETKRFSLLLRVQFMLSMQNDMREALREGITLWPSERALIRMGIHQTAYHTLKHQKSGLVSDKEAKDVDEVLRPFEDEILPACKLGEWVDQGHVPPRLVKDVTWRPLTGRIETVFIENARGEMEGADAKGDSASTTDLLKNEALPCTTPKELLALMRAFSMRMNTAWQQSQDYYGAVVSSRIAKQFILERLPFDSIAWMGCTAEPHPDIGHPCGTMSKGEALRVLEAAMGIYRHYVAVVHFSPQVDDAGFAERQACTLAMLYFVLSVLRYACPADGGSLVTRMMRAVELEDAKTARFGSGTTRPFSLMQTTAAGEGIDRVMEFWSTEDPVLAVARQRILGCRDAEDKALRAICEVRGLPPRSSRREDLFATIPWSTARKNNSFMVKQGRAPGAELAMDIALELGLPRTNSTAIGICKEADIKDPEKACPPFIAQVCYQSSDDIDRACKEYGIAKQMQALLVIDLEPNGVPRKTDSAPTPTFTISEPTFNKEMNEGGAKAKLSSAKDSDAELVLGARLGRSFLEPEMHGVLARRGLADEDDVALAQGIDTFGNFLGAADAQALLSSLTTKSSMRIPLVLGFFAEARAGALFSEELRQVLWTAVFRPGPQATGAAPVFDSEAGPASGAGRSGGMRGPTPSWMHAGSPFVAFRSALLGGLDEAEGADFLRPSTLERFGTGGGLAAAAPATCPETAPAPASDLGSTYGALWHELAHAPEGTIDPLISICEEMARLSGNTMNPTFITPLAYMCRLVGRVMAAATCVLRLRLPHPAAPSTAQRQRLAVRRQALRRCIEVQLSSVLEFYETEAAKTKATKLTTMAKTHWALMREGFTVAELGDQGLGQFMGCVAFFHTYHALGKQHKTTIKAPEYRGAAPSPPPREGLERGAASGGGSKGGPAREGMEPEYLQQELRAPEIAVFNMLDAKRAELVAYLKACVHGSGADWAAKWGADVLPSATVGGGAASGAGAGVSSRVDQVRSTGDLQSALSWARRAYTSVVDSKWGAPTEAMHKNGAFEDEEGKLAIDGQVCRISASGGGGVVPLPAGTANSVDCKAFFGPLGAPFCTVTARKKQVTKYQVMTPPALAGYGSIEVHHWRAMEPKQYTSSLAMMGMPQIVENSIEVLEGTQGPIGGATAHQYDACLVQRGSVQAEQDGSPDRWVTELLSSTWLWALDADAADFKFPNSPNKSKYKDRQQRAKKLLHGLRVFGNKETLAAGGDEAVLYAVSQELTVRMVVLRRARRSCDVYYFQEFARRVFPVVHWTSDIRFCIGQLDPYGVELGEPVPAAVQFRCGDSTREPISMAAVEIKRTRQEPGSSEAVTYSLIPPFLLNGTIPYGLLEKGLQWWLKEDSSMLVGEPRPASYTRAVAQGAEEQKEGDAKEGEGDGDGDAGGDETRKTPVEGEDAVYVAMLDEASTMPFLGPITKSSVRIFRKPLFPGMNGDGPAAAAARARFPGAPAAEEAEDGSVARPPGLKPDYLLLDLSNAPPGSPLDRLGVTLARGESLSHVLAWAFEPSEAKGGSVPPVPWPLVVQPEESVELQLVELPRLETSFECRALSASEGEGLIESAYSRGHGSGDAGAAGGGGGGIVAGLRPARLYLSDRGSDFLCDRRTAGQQPHNYLASGDTSKGDDGISHASPGGHFENNSAPPPLAENVGSNLGPSALMKGLSHALLLESDSGALSLFVPSHKLERPLVKKGPFSTWTLQARGDIEWWVSARSRSFVLEVSVSESFLKLPSVGAALYYLNCLLLKREYELATRLLQSIDTDRALAPEESFWLQRIGSTKDDITPDMHAIRVKLALALRFGNATMPFDSKGAYFKQLSVHGHVRASCRLSRAEHQAACDMLGSEDLSGKWRALRYGDSVEASFSASNAASGNFYWYLSLATSCLGVAESFANAQLPRMDSTGNRLEFIDPGRNNWMFSLYGYTRIGDKSGSARESVDKINEILAQPWNQHAPHLIDLALGRTRIKLVEGGEECGRRFSRLLSRWLQGKTGSWKGGGFAPYQMVQFYIPAVAGAVNPDGSKATEGSSGGWPVPTDKMFENIRTVETQTWVRDWFRALHQGAAGSIEKSIDAAKWKGKEDQIPWDRFPCFMLRLEVEPDDGTANPRQEITSDMLPPDPPGCFDTCPDRPLVLRTFDHSGNAAANSAGASESKRRDSVSGGGGLGMDVSIDKLDLAQFATMPLGLLAEEHTLVLTAEQAKVRIPSGKLPFDKTTGQPIESSFVADSMLKRLEESCATYKEIVAGRSEDAMACLVVDANLEKQRHPSADELVAMAPTAQRTLASLQQSLVRQRRADLADVRRGFASVLRVLNRIEEVEEVGVGGTGGAASGAGADSDRPPLVVRTSLERLAFQRTYVWDELLLGTLLSSRPEQDLFNQNPCMSAERARAAIECAHALALKANRVSQANRCIGLAQRLQGMVAKIEASAKSGGGHFGDAVSPEAMEALRYAQQDLAGAMRCKRHYASIFPNVPLDYHKLATGASDAREVQEISMDSRFLMLELINGWVLRDAQVDVVCRFCEEACVNIHGLPPAMQFGPYTGLAEDQMYLDKPGFKGGASGTSESKTGSGESKSQEPPVPVDEDGVPDLSALEEYAASLDPSGSGVQSRVRSLAMGLGKTTCVSVLMVLAMADGKRLTTVMVPPALLAQTQDLMWAAFARIMPKRVVTFNFTRSSADNPAELAALRRKLEDTAEQRGLVLTSPGAVKSMQLLFVEQAGKAMGTDGKGTIRMLSGDKRDQAKKAAQELAKITDMFGRSQGGRLLMDEVDMILSPLKSELLYPAGNTVMLQPRPHRWTFVVDLLETVTTAALLEGAGDFRRCALIAVDTEGGGTSGTAEFKAADAGDSGSDDADEAMAAAESSASLADVQSGRGPLGPFRRAIREGLDSQMLQSSPHLVLLNKAFYRKALRPAAAEWSRWWLMSSNVLQSPSAESDVEETGGGVSGAASPVTGKELEVVLQVDPATTDSQALDALRAVAGRIGPNSQAALRIVLDWLNSLLAHVLGKVNRVTYGMLGPGDIRRLEAMGGDGLGRERLLTAVPFVGKDVPSEMSSFAQPDCLIGITTSAYLYEGLMPRHIVRVVKVQRFKMGRESGPHRQRPSRIEFQRWVDDAMRVWRVRFGRASRRIARARQRAARPAGDVDAAPGGSTRQIPTAEDLGLSEDSYAEATAGPPMVPPLEFLQVTDTAQMQQVCRLFRLFGPMVRNWMLTYVFPSVTDHQEAKFSSSGCDLGSDCLFGARYGFSGTPSALAPLDLGECDFEPGSEGRFLDVLTDPQVVWDASDELIPGREWTVPGLLKQIACANPPYHALIDAGALITGMSNQQAAAYMLRVGLQGMEGCVFLDEDNRKMMLVRGKPDPVPLAEAGIPRDKRCCIYDQSHTTGMDIKQTPNARAVLTLGKDCTFRDAAQAAWRMRGLAKGQTLRLCVVPEVQGLVKQAVGDEAFERDPKIRSVVGWLVRNSIEHESLQFQQLCRQDLSNVWRRAAFDDLMSVFGISGRRYAEKGLVPDLRTVQERVGVFREPVDFTPKLDLGESKDDDSPAASDGADDETSGAPLSKLAAWARESIPQYIRGDRAERRLYAVLKRNAIGAGTSSAKKTQHLDQEQEQEQEVLQEAEREQDQEKELEYVAWFKRPDIDIVKPAPWRIDALGRASRQIHNYADSGDGAKSQGKLIEAMGGGVFHASEWKPEDDAPLLEGLRPGLCLSEWFTLKDAQNLPEYRVQFAQVGLTFAALAPDPRGASALAIQADGSAAAAAAGYRPGGGALIPALSSPSHRRVAGATPFVVVSLAEAEALRRALHAASAGRGGEALGQLGPVQLWNVSLGTLIDSGGGPSSASGGGGAAGSGAQPEVTRAPAWDVRIALGRFANCDVYLPEESASAALEPLAAVPTDVRRLFFERLARRRRGGTTAWAGTPVAKLLTVRDLSQLRHRDEQVQRVRQALASKGWDPDRLFRELDEDRSGTLSILEFRKLVGQLDLPLPESDVTDLLHAADRDMDGFVTVSEFRRAFAAVEDSGGTDAQGVSGDVWV